MNKLTKFQLCGKHIQLSASLDADGKPQYTVSFETDGIFTRDGLRVLMEEIKEDIGEVLTFYPKYKLGADGTMVETGEYILYNAIINQFEYQDGGDGDAD